MEKELKSNDKSGDERSSIHNFYYSRSNVLSMDPNDDKFQKFLQQHINKYRVSNKAMIEYGKKFIDILQMRIDMAVGSNDLILQKH